MSRTGKAKIMRVIKALGVAGLIAVIWTVLSICAVYFGKPAGC